MSTATGSLTYDDLLAMPDDGARREVIDGELFVSPPPRRIHQEIVTTLFLVLGPHVEREGLGRVYVAPIDVLLEPHGIAQPDLLFLRRDRLHLYQPEGVIEGPPDLVVEILSPSTRRIDLGRKAALYERGGVSELWIVDPEQPELPELSIRTLVNGRYRPVAPDADGRLRSLVLPGLVIDPAALFANLG